MRKMNKKNTWLILSLASVMTLTGCTYTTTVHNDRFTRRLVSSHPLNNGNTLMIGAREPGAENQCKLIATVPSSYVNDRMKGQFSIHMGDGAEHYLDQQAVDFANAHANVNYAFIYMPTTHAHGFESGNFSESTTQDVSDMSYYYDCQNPPKAHSNPFKD